MNGYLMLMFVLGSMLIAYLLYLISCDVDYIDGILNERD